MPSRAAPLGVEYCPECRVRDHEEIDRIVRDGRYVVRPSVLDLLHADEDVIK